MYQLSILISAIFQVGWQLRKVVSELRNAAIPNTDVQLTIRKRPRDAAITAASPMLQPRREIINKKTEPRTQIGIN